MLIYLNLVSFINFYVMCVSGDTIYKYVVYKKENLDFQRRYYFALYW